MLVIICSRKTTKTFKTHTDQAQMKHTYGDQAQWETHFKYYLLIDYFSSSLKKMTNCG